MAAKLEQKSFQQYKKRKFDEVEEKDNSGKLPPLKKHKAETPSSKSDNIVRADDIDSTPRANASNKKGIVPLHSGRLVFIFATTGAFDILMSNSTASKFEKKSPKPKASGGWNSALIPYCTHPENFPEQIYFTNDKVVAMYGTQNRFRLHNLIACTDVYPKAKLHMLVMPRQLIPTFADLNEENIPIIENVIKIGKGLLER